MSRSLYSVAYKECVNELTDYTVYKELARIGKTKKSKAIFEKLTGIEYKHYRFWKRYCPDANPQPDMIKARYVLFLRHIFGESFLIKYLEGGESAVIKKYGSYKPIIPKKDRQVFAKIIEEEEEHERGFADQIEDTTIKYVSFVVLGLADALVEVAGIHAGSLGIYNSTFLTGLAGIVAGAAASLSMASAAYAQAKQGFTGSASMAAMYTGLSYFIGAVILATPYFVTSTAVYAIVISLILGMAMIGLVSWYNSVMSGSNSRKEFFQLAGIMVGVTMLLLVIGFTIRSIFGISI